MEPHCSVVGTGSTSGQGPASNYENLTLVRKLGRWITTPCSLPGHESLPLQTPGRHRRPSLGTPAAMPLRPSQRPVRSHSTDRGCTAPMKTAVSHSQGVLRAFPTAAEHVLRQPTHVLFRNGQVAESTPAGRYAPSHSGIPTFREVATLKTTTAPPWLPQNWSNTPRVRQDSTKKAVTEQQQYPHHPGDCQVMTFPRETGVYPANSRLTSAFPRLVASPHKSRARFDATRTTSSADTRGR